jgi:hypothetical protein
LRKQRVTETDRNQILETDAIESPPGAAEPAQPVVVVQYRSRGVPIWALVLLIFLIPVTSILVYHRLVVERFRRQSSETRQALESIIDGQKPKSPKPAEGGQPGPLAYNSQPFVEAKAPPAPAPAKPAIPGPPSSSPAAPSKEASTTGAAAISSSDPARAPADKKPVEPDGTPPPAVAQKGAPSADLQGGPKAKGARTILPSPLEIDEPDEPTAPNAAATDPKVAAGEGFLIGPPDPPAAQPPLPTKDQEQRMIKAEAAAKEAALDQMKGSKEAEIRSIRDDERRKFREELRVALRNLPDQAASEIDKVAGRYGYDIDPERMKASYRIWVSRMSQAAKVRLIRELGLPETVILNYLSDEFSRRIRTRNGPRNQSEARARAARQLLLYELPALTGSDGAEPEPAGGRAPVTPGDRATMRIR